MVIYLSSDAMHAILEVMGVFDTIDHQIASASEVGVGGEDTSDLATLAIWTSADWRLRLRLGDRLAIAGT